MGHSVVLESVTKTYKKGGTSQDALKRVSIEIEEGEAVAIMGPSGSGKSTLLQLVGGVDYPTLGMVTVNGQQPKQLSDSKRSKFRLNTVGFIFQQFYLQPFLSALDNVALPLRLNGVRSASARLRAKELLTKVGLEAKLTSRPAELSGGEMQRVAIARALANNPKVLLADEPTGNLDRENADAVVRICKDLSKEGTTVIVVTHDEKVASEFKRVIYLENGVVIDRKAISKKAAAKKTVSAIKKGASK